MTEKLPLIPKMPEIVKFSSEGEIASDSHNQERFIISFTEAWNQIPAEDRRAIKRYFEENSRQLEVQLRDRHDNLKRGPSGCADAQYVHCRWGSDEIVYLSLVAKKLTDDSRRYWIAHELAHLFLQLRDPNHGELVYEVAEDEVAELLVKRWGYKDDSEKELNVEVFLINLPGLES